MRKPNKIVSNYLKRIGETGGRAGRGAKKNRGDTDYYAELGRRGAAARKALREPSTPTYKIT